MLTPDQCTPEEIREQNRPLVQELGRYYDTHAEDNASLARIRERLRQKTAASLPVADTGKISHIQASRARDPEMESRHTSAKARAQHPVLPTLAAAVLVVVLIGFFALVLQRRGTSGGSRPPGSTLIGSVLSSCASQLMPVLVDLCTHHQLTDLQQSRQLGTYVIELERAYLDMNQLLITYRVFFQSTGRQIPAGVMDALVTTSQGLSFRQSAGEDAAGMAVVQFGTSALPADTHIVQFQLEVKALNFPVLRLPPEGTAIPQPSIVRGSATFDFTLSYHGGLVVTPHQTVTVNGNSVTLEHVLISPSETIVEGTTQGTIPSSPAYTFLLDAAGRHASPASSGFGGNRNPFSIRYSDGLLGQHGIWTFEISTASAPEGPWVFHFRVP